MRKMFGLLVIMALLYSAAQFLFKFIEKGHEIEYKLVREQNTFNIKETYVVNNKKEIDNYYFDININNSTNFTYQTFVNLNMQGQVIKDIKLHVDSLYVCILPIFAGDKILTDIICKKDNEYIFYNYIKGTDAALDAFASSLKDLGYDETNYVDQKKELAKDGLTTAYDSIIKGQFFSLENYKGIYTLNNINLNKIYDMKIFDKDIYQKELSAYVKNYYLIADYNKETKFNEFILINILNNTKTKISYDYDISIDSYVQGVVGNSVYIFDRDSLKQYEVNIKTKTIIEVGNENTGIKKYINKEFINVKAYDALNSKMLFSEYSVDNTVNFVTYDLVEKIGFEKSGYYYMYVNSGKNYKVYRSNTRDINTKTYIFSTDDINNVVYYKDYVYYKEGNTIKRFSDKYLVSNVLENSEIAFNRSLKLGIYFK